MKKYLICIVSFLAAIITTAAIAEVNPMHIEQALAAKDYKTAVKLTSVYVADSPYEARAHLLKAYLLIHVYHKEQDAINEIELVDRLDTSGKVRRSKLYARVEKELGLDTVPIVTPSKIIAPASEAQYMAETSKVRVPETSNSTVDSKQPEHLFTTTDTKAAEDKHPIDIAVVLLCLGLFGAIAYLSYIGYKIVKDKNGAKNTQPVETTSISETIPPVSRAMPDLNRHIGGQGMIRKQWRDASGALVQPTPPVPPASNSSTSD